MRLLNKKSNRYFVHWKHMPWNLNRLFCFQQFGSHQGIHPVGNNH